MSSRRRTPSSEASTWVVQVSLDKRALEDRGEYVEKYKLFIGGQVVDLSKEAGDELTVVVQSVQELNDQNPDMSVRVAMFDSVHAYAINNGLEFSGLVSYDLYSTVMFEYTWVRNFLASVDTKLVRAKGPSPRPITRENLFWN